MLLISLVLILSPITVFTHQGKALGRLDKEEKYYYKEGERYGKDDRKAGRSADYRRYIRNVPSRYIDEFAAGYNDGYGKEDKPILGGKIKSQEDAYYDLGFRRGKQDYNDGLAQDYRRHRREYTAEYEKDFRRGYNDGYNIREDRSTGIDDSNAKMYYDKGFDYGRADAVEGRRNDYRRYSREYTSRYEDTFRKGYERGYEQGRQAYKDAAKQAYDLGYQRGSEDYRAGRSKDYRRYRNEYDPRYEPDFRDGYNAGYGDRFDVRSAYDRGYDFGQEDYHARRQPDYRRYRSEFTPATENDFRRGYDDGYSGRRRSR
ncbi:MAG: hypothetical protein RMM17_00440 [Acidobacteriota bacterium]|nr:hypothetical protein [Blastocatellia bacterium]MDW8411134.1 hypothetical protein [Acidobacteriota bacterium]